MFRSTLVGLIFSVVMMDPASAAAGVAPTNLTIHADESQVYGKLTGRPPCRDGQSIELIVDGAEFATTTTGVDGTYSFVYELVPPVEVRARFDGSTTGGHPDTLICMASLSRVLRFVPGTGPAEPSGVTRFTRSPVAVATISVGTAIITTLATWLRGQGMFRDVM